MVKRLVIILILILLILGSIAYVFLGLNNPKDTQDHSEILIEIPMGSTTGDIGVILESNGVIKNANMFKLYSRLNGFDNTYVAGAYTLSPSMTTEDICKIISSGETTSLKFTVPEGYTIYDIADAMSDYSQLDGDNFLRLVKEGDYSEYEFLKGAVSGEHRLEGYLFPDTYLLSPGGNEEDLIKSMLDRFQVEYDAIKSDVEKKKMSLNQILTVASIIEKETMHLEDKPLVSSVIYNRLDIGMKLQMDTTIIYAMRENKVDLTYDDMEYDSPYNTYIVDGLPIGPICCPGRDSIDAAINPAKTDYFYFVLTDQGDGTIAYSHSHEEFLKDKEAYYAAQDEDD